jgi:pilus assembly protein Flp/PilA
MLQFLKTWLEMREEGQGLVEYGLIIALVAVVAVGALGALGGGVTGVLETITGSL